MNDVALHVAPLPGQPLPTRFGIFSFLQRLAGRLLSTTTMHAVSHGVPTASVFSTDKRKELFCAMRRQRHVLFQDTEKKVRSQKKKKKKKKKKKRPSTADEGLFGLSQMFRWILCLS